MKLLLVRHADAGDASDFARTGKPDSQRPLSDDGRKDMRAVARGLREITPDIDLVVSSPYVRAVQTATILREAYDIGSLSETPTLQPEARPGDFEKWLGEHRNARLIAAVGHEPNLGMLATWFVAGKLDSRVRMKKAGACLLDFDDEPRKGEGVLHWLMTAKQLERFAD